MFQKPNVPPVSDNPQKYLIKNGFIDVQYIIINNCQNQNVGTKQKIIINYLNGLKGQFEQKPNGNIFIIDLAVINKGKIIKTFGISQQYIIKESLDSNIIQSNITKVINYFEQQIEKACKNRKMYIEQIERNNKSQYFKQAKMDQIQNKEIIQILSIHPQKFNQIYKNLEILQNQFHEQDNEYFKKALYYKQKSYKALIKQKCKQNKKYQITIEDDLAIFIGYIKQKIKLKQNFLQQIYQMYKILKISKDFCQFNKQKQEQLNKKHKIINQQINIQQNKFQKQRKELLNNIKFNQPQICKQLSKELNIQQKKNRQYYCSLNHSQGIVYYINYNKLLHDIYNILQQLPQDCQILTFGFSTNRTCSACGPKLQHLYNMIAFIGQISNKFNLHNRFMHQKKIFIICNPSNNEKKKNNENINKKSDTNSKQKVYHFPLKTSEFSIYQYQEKMKQIYNNSKKRIIFQVQLLKSSQVKQNGKTINITFTGNKNKTRFRTLQQKITKDKKKHRIQIIRSQQIKQINIQTGYFQLIQ